MILKSSLQDFNSNRTLIKANDYLYALPNELLRPYISNYTITFPNKNTISEKYTVIPNGSSTLVFTFNGNKIDSILYGAATKINMVGEAANLSLLLLIVEFQPYGLQQFVRINQSDITDLLLPLDIVNLTLYKEIYSVFDQASNIYELISELDNVFLSYIGEKMLNSELALAVESIIMNMGNITVKELSSSVYYSERHMNRIFGQYIGINIKSFTRLVRINKTIKLLKTSPHTITAAALQTGFYDQSHFIHEFKAICNVTPQEYLKNMSDYYNEEFKF